MPPKGKNPPKKPVSDDEDDDVEDLDITQGGNAGGLPAGLLGNIPPELLAQLQARMGGMVGSPSGLIQSLPREVVGRLDALRKVQKEHLKLEVEFHKRVAALEQEFAPRFKPLYEKRTNIVKGIYEPTAEETKHEHSSICEDECKLDAPAPAKPEEAQAPVKGIPNFWLTVLQTHDAVSQLIFEQDFPVLEHLEEISVELLPEINTGFTLHFKFSANEFFTNEVLSKTYHLDPNPEEDEMIYEGASLDHAEGTKINWNEGKDTTVKTVKKKQKKKGASGKTRTVIKHVPTPSFFDFFSPPHHAEETDDDAAEDDYVETEDKIALDFEIGEIIKEKLVPEALLWFTGEALEYENQGEDDGDYYGDEGDEDDDDDDDDHDPTYHPPAGGQQPPGECKQS